MKARLLLLAVLVVLTLTTTGQTKRRAGATTQRTTTAATSWKRQYTKVEKLPKGSYSRVWKGELCGLVDGKGKVLIPVEYAEVRISFSYEEGQKTFTVEASNGKCGAYDIEQGKEIVPCEFVLCLAKVTQGIVDVGRHTGNYSCDTYLYGLYDTRQHKLITPMNYSSISSYMFKDQHWCSSERHHRGDRCWTPQNEGIISITGEELLPPDYTIIEKFCGDIVIVAKGGSARSNYPYDDIIKGRSYALYDASPGKQAFITQFDYNYIKGYCDEKEGLSPFYKGGVAESKAREEKLPKAHGGKWGFIDKTGKEVIPAQYDMVTEFTDGIAQVTKDGVTTMLENPLKGSSLLTGGKGLGRQVDTNIPETSRKDENLFAFIFATENYAHLQGADFAINDGKVFADYCKKTLGVPEKNVRYFEDATYGNVMGAMKKMQDIADVYEGDAKILVYFAGLGATNQQTGQRYLLPSDATLQNLNATGFSVAELQKTLNSMKTAKTLVILDVPFSNVDRNGKMLASARGVAIKAKPIDAQGNADIWISSQGNETAFASKDYSHGLFTFALLQQLQATKGTQPLDALFSGAAQWVSKHSLQLFDKVQTPQRIAPAGH